MRITTSQVAAVWLMPGVLPMLRIPPMPCWLTVQREIRGSRIVRRDCGFRAEATPRALAG